MQRETFVSVSNGLSHSFSVKYVPHPCESIGWVDQPYPLIILFIVQICFVFLNQMSYTCADMYVSICIYRTHMYIFTGTHRINI